MKRFKWQNIRLILILFVMVFLFAFALNRNNKRKIEKIKVEFQGDNKMFLTHEMVNNLLIQNLKQASTIQKEQVDLMDLESVLENHPFIEQAEVFASEDGMLITKVQQKSPIARMVNNSRNFYVDKNGNIFELSSVYSARVPLVKGIIKNEFKKGFIGALNEINKDDFLKKNIIAIEVLKDGSLKMIPREYDYEIIFGKPILIEKKFKNYKAFYQFATRDTLLDKYKSINLMFTQQVVCSK
jgi:cell division protein FtsQ